MQPVWCSNLIGSQLRSTASIAALPCSGQLATVFFVSWACHKHTAVAKTHQHLRGLLWLCIVHLPASGQRGCSLGHAEG